jgi:hypothetical protein
MPRLISKQNLTSNPLSLIFIIIIVCLIFVGYYFIPRTSELAYPTCKSSISSLADTSIKTSRPSNDIVAISRTLIIYVFGKSHALAEQNLAFFIRTAVRQSHHADYYFILQQINNEIFDETKLPILPSNADYIQHENRCFDIGTVGWFLSSGMIDRSRYKYFIFLNSSVRGPFIVSYYDSSIWYTIFTRRLNDHIKLVGCTISCQISTHVQSYLWALDLETLDFLLKNSTVFACHESMDHTINNAEIGASKILLDSGYGIDSLMRKYQDVDFRYNRTTKCVDKLNPTCTKAANGITLDPYEVVFVKMKGVAYQDLENRERVNVYEKWLHRCQ